MHSLKQCFLCAGMVALVSFGCAKSAPQSASSSAATTAPSKTPPALPAVTEPGKHVLFDGKTLNGWGISDFSGRGPVSVTNGQINLGEGYMTGVNWTGAVPKMNYEVSLEAKRVEGSDFFCGLTFPVGEEFATFVVGGWGGSTVGISSVDGEDASQNETSTQMNFTNGQWYRVRVRVTPGKIDAWINDEQVVKLDARDRRLSVRLEVEVSKPLGVATWNTGAALRNIQLTALQ